MNLFLESYLINLAEQADSEVCMGFQCRILCSRATITSEILGAESVIQSRLSSNEHLFERARKSEL